MVDILIHLSKLSENLARTQALCKARHVELIVVTKCCGGHDPLLQYVVAHGADMVADSHPYTLQSVKKQHVPIMALQVPFSSAPSFSYCDYLYSTELSILERLSHTLTTSPHHIIVPIEMGDLREGVPVDQLLTFLKDASRLKNIRIAGFSANFGCIQHVIPDPKHLEAFVRYTQEAVSTLDLPVPILSLGGTTIWSLLQQNLLPPEITHVRFGEGIFLGYDLGIKQPIEGFHQDVFLLEGEILEIKTKDTVSDTLFQESMYLHPHTSKSTYIRKRAVLDVGYMSCPCAALTPVIKGIEIVGYSQDHMVVDVTEAERTFATGDSIQFFMNYEAVSRAMVSCYVNKIYIQ